MKVLNGGKDAKELVGKRVPISRSIQKSELRMGAKQHLTVSVRFVVC